VAWGIVLGLGPGGAATGPLVTGVRFIGNTVFSDGELRPRLTLQPGQPFDAAALERDVEAVEAYYHSHGCPFALVTADYGLKEGGVVEIPIAEGRIEAIEIQGHRKTKAQVIRRALETQVGDVFYAPRIDRERQRLFHLGLFEQITFTPRAGSDVGWIVLKIEVREARSFGGFGVVGFSPGAGLVGYVDLAENNLGGRGQRLSVQWSRGAYLTRDAQDRSTVVPTRAGYEISFDAPQVGSRRRGLGLALYRNTTRRYFYYSGDVDPDNPRNYEWRRGLSLRWQQEQSLTRRWLWEVAQERIDYDLVPPGLAPPGGYSFRPTTLTHLTATVAHDTRDHPFHPRRGRYDAASLQVGTVAGHDARFAKLWLERRRYQPWPGNRVLAWRALGGGSLGRLPLAELYGLGGGETLRGYAWDRFGGTRVWLASAELRMPAGEALEWATFVDAGYAWPWYRDLQPADLRLGGGLGLRASTPFGPLRLDVAYGREGLRSHFYVGQPF